MHEDLHRVVTMILDMRNINIKYFNQGNHVNEQWKEIRTIAHKLKLKLQIKNIKRPKAITLLEAEVAKSNWYERMINMFQNSLSVW